LLDGLNRGVAGPSVVLGVKVLLYLFHLPLLMLTGLILNYL